MKVSNSRSTKVALVVAAGAVAVSVFWLSRGNTEEPAPAKPARPSRTAKLPTLEEVVPRPAPTAGSAEAKADPEQALAEPTPPTDDFEYNPLAGSLRAILMKDEQLNTFMYFHNRPLLSEDDREKFHDILSDPSVFAQVKQDLLYPEETRADQNGNIKRLLKIDYLRDALEWKENPMRPVLIAMISEMLLTDNYPAGMTMDMRLSLSGNKMELYELLYEVAPEQAQATLLASKGTRVEKLIAYIDSTIQTRKRLEASLENEVRP